MVHCKKSLSKHLFHLAFVLAALSSLDVVGQSCGAYLFPPCFSDSTQRFIFREIEIQYILKNHKPFDTLFFESNEGVQWYYYKRSYDEKSCIYCTIERHRDFQDSCYIGLTIKGVLGTDTSFVLFDTFRMVSVRGEQFQEYPTLGNIISTEATAKEIREQKYVRMYLPIPFFTCYRKSPFSFEIIVYHGDKVYHSLSPTTRRRSAIQERINKLLWKKNLKYDSELVIKLEERLNRIKEKYVVGDKYYLSKRQIRNLRKANEAGDYIVIYETRAEIWPASVPRSYDERYIFIQEE